MFLSSRVVPQTPPSLVKFRSRALAVMTGASRFGAEQRPRAGAQERAVPPANTDATADPVSWQAGATTGVPASAALTSLLTCPTIVPGSTSGWQQAGRQIRARRAARVAQVRVLASMNCVVVAIVYSAASSPVSQ